MPPVPVVYEALEVYGGLLVPKKVPLAKLLANKLRSSHWASMVLPLAFVHLKIASTRLWELQESCGNP